MMATMSGALAWIGRQGTRAVAALVVIGVAFPPLGGIVRPYVTEAVFVLLCLAFLRVEPAALLALARRPAIVLAASAWTSIAVPLLFGAAGLAAGIDVREPDLFLALVLQGAASPMMAAPALAALMGLDAALVLASLVLSSALLPITAPLVATAFLGQSLAIAPLALAGKLLALLAGAAVLGASGRSLLGASAVRKRKEMIDGINVLVLFVFVAAVMGSVAPAFIDSPARTGGLAVLAVLAFFAVFLATLLIFLPAGKSVALALAFMAAQRNMGLMLAATGGTLPELAWLYFALSQLPIYLSPQLLRPLARRLTKAAAAS